ncbi:MAG: hypothetical protein KatS3mg055_1073 [Chloroflexus sp.]|jgi:hypothetical protein|uniref:Uncharacterized protein n=1 Tax=Chloroflexus aggregans (strain MD-66 / DSM 9485) TaxID=326427 RepID=B8GDC0_CHLAD|nr:hypothetical protein [Chloroflexus sp.]ACL25187.1 hypothetical protein Cagg_2308 [Chloroflexus aggregans DSM 9485]GIV88555.1 MAG: hypothetical protein KatS3mg055_1073 [Chloroflexus sp.]
MSLLQSLIRLIPRPPAPAPPPPPPDQPPYSDHPNTDANESLDPTNPCWHPNAVRRPIRVRSA